MDMNRMTLKVQEALQAASALAMHRSHQGIDVEHDDSLGAGRLAVLLKTCWRRCWSNLMGLPVRSWNTAGCPVPR